LKKKSQKRAGRVQTPTLQKKKKKKKRKEKLRRAQLRPQPNSH
jgi:hypothetical protein